MADTVSSTNKLYIGFTNHENKLKYISLPNPKSSLTAETVQEKAQALLDNNIIIDTSSESGTDTYIAVTTAYTERKTITKLDI